MILPFLLGVSATVGVALVVSSAVRARPADAVDPEGQLVACAPGLVFFGPRADSVASRAIDAGTGGLGFSHVAVQGCEVGPGGVPLLVDCTPGRGVHRRPESDYGDRPRGRLLLTGPLAGELYGCARAKVGADYGPFPGAGGYLCAQMALDCLPAELRTRATSAVRFAGPGGIVSPNQLAASFGVRPGRVVVV